MRSDLNGFLRYLKQKRILDDSSAVFRVADSLDNFHRSRGLLKWSYDSGKTILRLEPASVTWPKDPTSLLCSMVLRVVGTVTAAKSQAQDSRFHWEITRSEMELEFSAESKSLGVGWSQFWHFETHIDETDTIVPDEAHPMFHLHFGGREMAARRQQDPAVWGHSLELKGPRFVHPPLDLILALDFVLSNSTGPLWKHELLTDKQYTAAVRNSQRRFWQPYQRTLWDFYDCGWQTQATHRARLFCPTLLVDEL
jgi:hypothetical protein